MKSHRTVKTTTQEEQPEKNFKRTSEELCAKLDEILVKIEASKQLFTIEMKKRSASSPSKRVAKDNSDECR